MTEEELNKKIKEIDERLSVCDEFPNIELTFDYNTICMLTASNKLLFSKTAIECLLKEKSNCLLTDDEMSVLKAVKTFVKEASNE